VAYKRRDSRGCALSGSSGLIVVSDKKRDFEGRWTKAAGRRPLENTKELATDN